MGVVAEATLRAAGVRLAGSGGGGGVLAHGLGGRTDLPMDGVTAIAGGGAAVAVSFLALTVAWTRPRLRPDGGRPLPAGWARLLDAPWLTWAGRWAALVLTAAVVAVAFAGPSSDARNLAPWALFVTFWVGLVPVSVVFGPVWRRVNPLRTLHAALCGVARVDPAGVRALPKRLGWWPAAGWLLGFVWLELVAPHRSDPRLVGWLVVEYAAVNTGLAVWFGRDWFTRGDGFEAYSSLMARMCPVGRRPDGVLVWRTPLTGLVGGAGEPGLAAAACVLIGSTGFDGVTRTTYWRDSVNPADIPAGTAGLLVSVGVVAGLYWSAMWSGARLSGQDAREWTGRFAGSLLPIALGYTVAHYFSFFLLEGQTTVILASDPLGRGWDLLGSTGHVVDYGLLTPSVIALVQVNAIVLGHMAGTATAHDLALRTVPAGRRLAGQAPLAVVMVCLTCAGLFALLSG
ncbi:hypothetical protein [Actinomadura rupiterrae]|uniref:hypothetical protein n=1 Tax=Actinomadura rupiterrae TaxID=559627 RepID=UPI0020A37AF6|nr:hypothetical protein [Actinomadura rupiterrae]MCP2343265.1 hypothetical protein [Actinomadura rupiterrae]